MTAKKTLHVRERELQILHSTPAGLAELKALASTYALASGHPYSDGESIITYLLVYERDKELIVV